MLILDEPTDGLDPNQKHEVRQLIADMSANKIIVISTHILEEVDAVCNRAIIIANGRINERGEFVAEEVLAKHDENYMPPELADMHLKQEATQ